MIKIPSDTLLKAYYGDDELYLDENGKHIIFRNVRGRIVPIHVDSSDYVDWLKDQGIPIDNSSQANMQQAENILDYLDRIREVAGPDTAAKYEKQVLEAYKDYYQQASQLGYETALQNRAKTKGISADDLRAQYKKTYEDNKQNEVKASTNREGEWENYISEYTDRMLSGAQSRDVSSNEWGAVHAFDLALMVALGKAKKGEAPSVVNLVDILKEELKTRDVVSRIFSSRYDPKTDQKESGIAAISLMDGIETLIHNLDTLSPFGRELEVAFDKMYVRMYNDFDKPNQKNMAPMSGSIIPKDDFNVPDELPEEFDSQEANRLVALYKTQPTNKLGASHKVMIHTLARLWERIPEEKRVQAFKELSDDEKGLHRIHKLSFIRAFQDCSKGLREYNPDRVVEESLREALHVKDSTNYNEVVAAIKAIAVNMAHLDGYYASKSSDKGTPNQKEIVHLWNNSPVLAGRAGGRGEGPNLMQYFSSEEAREQAVFSNDILKVVHRGRMPKGSLVQQTAPAFQQNNTPPVPAAPDSPDTPSQPNNTTTGWRQDRNKFIDDSTGTSVTMTPVKLPSGVQGLKLVITNKDGTHEEVEKPILSKGKSKDEVLREVIGVVRGRKLATSQPQVQQFKPKSIEPEEKPRSASPEMNPDTAKLHQQILSEAVKLGYKITHVVGDKYVFFLPDSKEHSMALVVRKDTGKLFINTKSKDGLAWENHDVTSLEEARAIMNITSTPLLEGNEKFSSTLGSLGEIDDKSRKSIEEALNFSDENKLFYRGLGSISSIRIQNKSKQNNGYVSISKRDDKVVAHWIKSDGSIEEITLENLAKKLAELL